MRFDSLALAVAASAIAALPATPVFAAELYGGLGLPGLSAGVAHSMNDNLTLRADYTGLSSISVNRTENGIRYDGETTAHRLGLFADWFAFDNGFRFTGGLTFNRMSLDLVGRPQENTIQIGNNAYPVAADDRFTARIEFPNVTPYLGIGWGHHRAGSAWGFHADLGASIGRPSVTTSVSGALATQPGIQADIDRETAELRDTAERVRFIPQLSLGVSYRF